MTKKTKLIILLSVLLLLVAVVGCTLQWFFSPGIHSLFGYTHVDIHHSGYLLDADGTLLSEGHFTASGMARHVKEGKNVKQRAFQLSLTGFPELDANKPSIPFIRQHENGSLVLQVIQTLDVQQPEHIYYDMDIDSNDYQLVAVRVTEYPEEIANYTYFIPADSLNEAQTILRNTLWNP